MLYLVRGGSTGVHGPGHICNRNTAKIVHKSRTPVRIVLTQAYYGPYITCGAVAVLRSGVQEQEVVVCQLFTGIRLGSGKTEANARTLQDIHIRVNAQYIRVGQQ